jgi:filamentous hemagglutinin family protein
LFTRRCCAAAALAVLALPAHAQIRTDGSVGARLTLVGPAYSIPSALGTQVGTNLFHSFSAFNVNTGQSATFAGAAGTSNVIARVTGTSGSNIDGQLGTSIAGANVWLINPHGIAFGPNATLNVSGSFHASTASYLKLGSTGRFDAANPSASNLTVDSPSAFGFLGAPAPITVDRSHLDVPSGATLSLVGGNLSITGGGTPIGGVACGSCTLSAPSGRINIASLASAGEVDASTLSATAGAFGNITLTSAALATDAPNAAGGPIFIRGGKLTLDTSIVSTLNQRPGAGADLTVELDGDLAMSKSVLRSSALRGGDAGDVHVQLANLTMTGGSSIEASSLDILRGLGGRAGSATIEATGDVALSGGSEVSSITFFGPPAGELRVHAANLSLSEGSRLNASTFGDGAAGNIFIDVDNLTMTSGGNVLAGALFDSHVAAGSGNGGNILVNASGGLDITGAGSGLFSATETFGSGGTITVNAGSVHVGSGGRISTASSDPLGLGPLVGNAGSMDITATGSIVLDGDGAITTASTTAGGGVINIHARDALALTDSRITTSVAVGGGNGGDINIDPVFVTLNSSQIIAQAIDGNGGDITIVTQFLIMSPDSIIDATSRFGLSGRVLVTSPQIDLGTRLGVLTSGYVDPASRLRDSCATRAGAGNSFVGVGHGGLPASPQSAAFAGYAPAQARQVGLVLPADPRLLCRS